MRVVDDARAVAGDGHSAWSESFSQMFMQVTGGVLERSGAACRWDYLPGLLSGAERKNSWQLAGFAGDASPDGMQRLLNFSPWDVKAARDATARYDVNAMGDPASVDDTGFLETGRMSAGGAGRVENCQAGVFAAYVTPAGSGR